MASVSKNDVLAYIQNNWDSNNETIEVMKRAYQAKDDNSATRALKKIIEAITGVYTTPANVIREILTAIKDWLS